MNDQESLHQLRESWPETEDYLQRVGQVNNDLMVLKETAQRDEYESALTWLDHLAVGVEDLTAHTSAVTVLQHLHRRGRSVPSASQVTTYQEIRDEHEALWEAGSETHPDVLDGPLFELTDANDQALWELPELQEQLLCWAAETAKRHDYQGPALTVKQATILMLVTKFLDQEEEYSPEWAAECLRSALSSDFFVRAGNPPQ